MQLVITTNYQAMAQWAANYIIGKINNAQTSDNKPFVLGLPTGSTPLAVYQLLVKAYQDQKVSFDHVVTFNMDEYVGLQQNHPASYYTFMWDNLFSKINIKPHNTHILNGLADGFDKECSNFEQLIVNAGGIDLFLGGVGEDGHIAFNEPGSSLRSRTRLAYLNYDTRLANSRFFDGNADNVPNKALTVGVGTVMDAKEVLILASGHNKARAVQQAVEGAVSQAWTVTALQLHPNATIVCDENACNELKVATYKYYKSMVVDGR